MLCVKLGRKGEQKMMSIKTLDGSRLLAPLGEKPGLSFPNNYKSMKMCRISGVMN